jgi:hydrogenase/urease accessory protein HupE
MDVQQEVSGFHGYAGGYYLLMKLFFCWRYLVAFSCRAKCMHFSGEEVGSGRDFND